MKPIEIITIVACVAIVVGVIVASIVRKLKGKPSMGCDCAGCAHAKECNGACCVSSGEKVDWSELVEKRKQELQNNKTDEVCTCEKCAQAAKDAQNRSEK